MNKVALLAVAAAGVLYASTTVSGLRADTNLKADSKLTELEILAQRTANTGLELAASQVQRDFDAWREFLDPGTIVSATGGTFKATASGGPAGPVVVAASGTVDTTSFDVYRMLARLAEASAAVSITSDSTIATLSGGDWVISGRDTPSYSQKLREEGYGLAGTEVPGVWTSTDQAEDAVRDALTLLTRGQVRGRADRADITRSGSAMVLQALASVARQYVTDAYAGDQSFSGQSFGSLGNPAVVQVRGNASFSGTTVGYGVLIVEGDLVASDDFEWHGLVVAEGIGALDVTLTSNATIYGALYIDHEQGGTITTGGTGNVPIGTGTFAPYTLWVTADQFAALDYYAEDNNGDLVRQREGIMTGIQEPAVGSYDLTDIETMTFDADGTLYFVNNANYNRAPTLATNSALYRVAASQFDGNASTPLRAERLGETTRYTATDEVRGLLFDSGSLYGMSKWGRWIYRMNLRTGEAAQYRQFAGPNSQWFSPTRAADGHVYVLRREDGSKYGSRESTHELWRFSDFPNGDPEFVTSIEGIVRSDALTAHPDGYLYLVTGANLNITEHHLLKINPSDGSYTMQPAPEVDSQASAYYYRGEEIAMGGMSLDATAAPAVSGLAAGASNNSNVAPLHRIPSSGGRMRTSGTATWPGHPSISVSASTTSRSGSHDGKQILSGSTLTALAQDADRNDVLLGASDINNPAYTGPASLSTFNLRPGASSGGVEAEVRFGFDRAFSEAFYFHVIDLDKVPMTIEAFDAQGRKVSTAGWTMSTPVDLILENGRAETATYVWRAGAGELRSSDSQDNETIAAQFLVDNYAQVREIRVRWSLPARQDDGNHFAFSTASLYAAAGVGGLPSSSPAAGGGGSPTAGVPTSPSAGTPTGGGTPRRTGGEPLRYTQRDDAAVYYSTEALGQLAAVLPAIREIAWVVEYDAFGMDVRGLFEDNAAEQAGRAAPRREDASRVLVCIDGRERKVSPTGLELYLAQGATEGACQRPGSGSTAGQGVPANPQALVSICHNGRTKQVRAGDLQFWLDRGARQGSCSAPPTQEQPTTRPVDDDRDDDSDDDD